MGALCLYQIYELLMSSWNSRKRPPSIVLPGGHLRELMGESQELSMSSPFKICVDVVLKPCLLFFSHDTAGHQVRTLTFKLLLFVKEMQRHLYSIISSTFMLCHSRGSSYSFYNELGNYWGFSHDFNAAMLVFQNNETVAMLRSQTNPVRVEDWRSYANAFFCSKKSA